MQLRKSFRPHDPLYLTRFPRPNSKALEHCNSARQAAWSSPSPPFCLPLSPLTAVLMDSFVYGRRKDDLFPLFSTSLYEIRCASKPSRPSSGTGSPSYFVSIELSLARKPGQEADLGVSTESYWRRRLQGGSQCWALRLQRAT